jgi:plastocyanin
MRRALAIAALAAAAAAAPAYAQEHGDHGAARQETGVSIQFAAFDPPAVDVLAGDTVMWANDSVRRHDVTADDGGWTSGNLIGGDMFAHAFATPGTVAYHCSIHPFMRGAVGVHELLLARPEAPAAPRRPFTVRGRSALDPGDPITLEADAGGGFTPVATTTAGEDGTFAASFTPSAPAQLRAVGDGSASPPVQLLVLDRTVAASGRARHGRAVVRTRVLPASPGATVVLQLRLRERFGWWPVRRAQLDRDSRASFRVDIPRSVRARVVLTLADGATPLAVSRTLRLGRPHRSGSHHHH